MTTSDKPQTTPAWHYFKTFPSQRKRLGEDGQHLNFAIGEVNTLGTIAFVCTEEAARMIVEDHNARI